MEYDGQLPSWVAQIDERVLLTRMGAATFARGAAYAKSRAVLDLAAWDDGQTLSATVRGSGGRQYETDVSRHPPDPRARSRATWTSVCSCPMHSECKHVVAVLITARQWLSRTPAAVAAPVGWQSQLAAVVRPSAPPSKLAPVGLQFEVVPTTPVRGRPMVGGPVVAGQVMGGQASRVRLRPVTLGASGRWIRTGINWVDIEDGYARYNRVEVQPEHREAARSLLTLYRSRQKRYASYGEPQIHLDDLGRRGWTLLAEAQQVGLELVSTRAKHRVVLAAGPATVVVDLRQPDPAGGVELALLVCHPREGDWAAGDLLPVGSPAHGAVHDHPDRLLLLPFDRPLDAATQTLLDGGAVEIPAPDLPVFFARYLPSLRERITVASVDETVEIPEVVHPRLVLQVRFEADHVTVLDSFFGYPVGDQLHLVADDDEHDGRNRSVEQELLAASSELPELPGLWSDATGRRRLAGQTRLAGVETARFVQDLLPLLLDREDLTVQVTGVPAAYAQSLETPLISVSTHDSDQPGSDWFDLQVTVSVSGQDVPLPDLLAALAQGQEHLILPSGTWFGLDRPELAALRRLVEEARSLQDKESTGLRLTAFHAGLWEELVALGVVEHQSARWTATVGGLLQLDQIPRPDAPQSLQATLRPYQLEGYHWLSLLWDHQLGGILADDMGLGKTVQTLAMAARAHEQGTLGGEAGPLLVVAPTSVVATWASEAARFVPGLSVVAITETTRRSGQSLTELARDAHLVVTSYALLRIDEDAYRAVRWSGLILDEAQFVKNHQAKTYQCARRLPAPFKLAITGTPLENSLMDLWSMLSITAPGLFPNPQRFTELFRRPIESGAAPEQLAVLRRRIRPLMLRRTKEQVAPDLPPKIEQVLEITLNPAHRKIYDAHLVRERQRVLGLLDDLQRNRIAILRSLTLLRQLSLDASLVDDKHAGKVRSSKLDVLVEQLHEIVAEGHRVLVFSQFTGFLSLVRDQLDEAGIGYCYLDGRTRNRPRRIAEFTEGEAPVFLISLKAGGVGLTLTEADYVFVLDPWWNPAAEAQAVDRAHRIGQTKTVMVYRLVASGTIEEKVVALQQRKRDLFARVVDDEAMTAAALTADDIRGLFA